MPYPFVGDLDLATVKCSPIFVKDGKPRVDISLGDGAKIFVQLCEDVDDPFPCKWALDQVRDDGDKTRRGQALLLPDPKVVQALSALDEHIVQEAIKHQKDWFKSKHPLSETTIRERYRPIVQGTTDDVPYIKFKVKVHGSKFPTKLHKMNADGKIAENKGRVHDLEARGATMVPILSTFGLYFMGGTSFGISFQAEEIVYTSLPKIPLANFTSKRPVEVTEDADEGDAKCAKVTGDEQGDGASTI